MSKKVALLTFARVLQPRSGCPNAPTGGFVRVRVANRFPGRGILYTSETGSIFHCPKKAVFHSSTMVHSLLLLVNQRLVVLPAACGIVYIGLGRRIAPR